MDRSLASKYNKVRASRVNEQNWNEYAHERKTERLTIMPQALEGKGMTFCYVVLMHIRVVISRLCKP